MKHNMTESQIINIINLFDINNIKPEKAILILKAIINGIETAILTQK